MDLVDVISKAHFTDTRIGGVSRKQRLRMQIDIAEQLQSMGLVEIIDPQPTTAKKSQQTEPLGAGGGKSSASSPVDQVSPKKTVIGSEKQASEPSQSTIHGEELDSPTSFMPVTDSGGDTITNKSQKNSKASSGRKTTSRQKSTASTE